jgi:hypothetical protein
MDIKDINHKTILIQNSYHPNPHLETELEIIEQLINQNNIVYYIRCQNNISSCFVNPKNNYLTCLSCISRVDNGIKHLQKFVNNDRLKIFDYNYFEHLNIRNYQKNYNFFNINELKSTEYKGYDVGYAALSSLVSYYRDHEPNLSKHKKIIDELIVSGSFLYDFFDAFLNEFSFDFVFIFNGRFNENRPLLRLCQKNDINFFTHERSGLLKKYLLRFNDIPHSLEATAEEIESLWKNGSEDRLVLGKAFFDKRKSNIEESWYSFSKNQKKGLLPSRFDSTKFNITIFNSSLDEYEGLEGFGPFFYQNDNEGIDEICTSLKFNELINVYLRVHPNLKNLDNAQNSFIDEKLSKHNNLYIIKAEDEIDTYELMLQSDLILTFGSTIGVEAANVNKNVILLSKSSYQNLDCVLIPESHSNLIELILNKDYSNKLFNKVNHESSLKYGYWQEKMGVFFNYYKPINISKGYYRDKIIKSNFFINYFEKINNRIIKFLK